MFTVIFGGYAENVPGDGHKMEQIRKENAKAMTMIDSLTIGFGVCAVTGQSQTNSGYRETYPPVAAEIHQAMADDLTTAQDEMRAALVNREYSADVLTFRM